MFDITSSKLLILGIVALLVIGPKDLPALLRTIGKYVGIIKRHAADFRAQFDEAMRESELAELRKEVEKVGSETEATLRSAEVSIDKEMTAAHQDVDRLMQDDAKPAADPLAHDAGELPATATETDIPSGTQPALNGASHTGDSATSDPQPAEDASSAVPQADIKPGA